MDVVQSAAAHSSEASSSGLSIAPVSQEPSDTTVASLEAEVATSFYCLHVVQ